MVIGASSFAGTFPELRTEVESIELYIPKLEVYRGTQLITSRIKKLKDVLSSYKISTSIHAPYFSDSPNYPHELIVDTARLNKTQERLLNESIGIGDVMGSEVVVLHPGRINGNHDKAFKNMVSNLSRIAEFAEDRNMILGLENKEGTDPENLCITASELMKAVGQTGFSNLGITFDIGHANLTCHGNPVLLREFSKIIKDSVVHVHVHDNTGSLTEKFWGDLHGAPGSGVIDFSVLRELDFNGIYNLEVFSIDAVRAGKKMLKDMNLQP